MTKATHNGTCQACGRSHAVTPNGLAKHGYTTRWGFFSGTCSGSDKAPLEQDTSWNKQVVQAIRDWADEQDAAADGEISTITIKIRTGYGQSDTLKLNREEYIAKFAFKKYGDHELAEEWTGNAFDKTVENKRKDLRRSAEHARKDAIELEKLRDRTFGNDLEPREAPDATQSHKEYFTAQVIDGRRVSAVAQAYDRQRELKEQGISSRVNRRNGVTLTYRA